MAYTKYRNAASTFNSQDFKSNADLLGHASHKMNRRSPTEENEFYEIEPAMVYDIAMEDHPRIGE